MHNKHHRPELHIRIRVNRISWLQLTVITSSSSGEEIDWKSLPRVRPYDVSSEEDVLSVHFGIPCFWWRSLLLLCITMNLIYLLTYHSSVVDDLLQWVLPSYLPLETPLESIHLYPPLTKLILFFHIWNGPSQRKRDRSNMNITTFDRSSLNWMSSLITLFRPGILAGQRQPLKQLVHVARGWWSP